MNAILYLQVEIVSVLSKRCAIGFGSKIFRLWVSLINARFFGLGRMHFFKGAFVNQIFRISSTVFLLMALLGVAMGQVSKEIPTAKPSAVGMSAEKLGLVEKAMEELVETNRIPGGVVLVARRGKIVMNKAWGKLDIESDRAMQTDTIMRCFSMTKAICTAGALMLCDEGKLAVDDPVSKYLPELANLEIAQNDSTIKANKTMTVSHLMTHTAGYGYKESEHAAYNNAFETQKILDASLPLDQLQKKLAGLPVLFEPGTDWRYGISIDVLGRVIEVVAGMPLDQFLYERFFKPLDMKDTDFFVEPAKVDRLASIYTSNANGHLKVRAADEDGDYLKRPALLSGGGGLVSTGRDYMRFLMMIANGGEFQGKQYLRPETVTLMTSNQLSQEVGWIKFGSEVRTGVGFSFGFSVREKMSDWDPQGHVGEYGWGGAASTHYWVSPEDDDLIVVTLEQVMPYSFSTEFKLKGLIYDAIEK